MHSSTPGAQGAGSSHSHQRNRTAGSSAMVPDGAFSLFPCRAAGDDLAAADTFLEARCATVPGSAFGAPGPLRCSFATATATATLEEGRRIIVATLDEVPA
ncbi:hypothetical protein [Streptomyces sp. NPDC054765]